MVSKSNASQKNKGDIAEMVSLPFTCVKNIYGNYIRNYIDTVRVTKNIQHGKRPPSVATYKLLGIVVGYIVNNSKDSNIVKYSQ